MQEYDDEAAIGAPSRTPIEALIAETARRELANVRERYVRLRLQFDTQGVAELLVRDLPFLLSEVELLHTASERKDETIFALRDEHNSLELASRALQSAIQQQRGRLESLERQVQEAPQQDSEAARPPRRSRPAEEL
ncbi:MAG TPA: hypothetical protein VK821_06445 [Dehalococcoidia bacterium]|nr:hypothetical protein [Dehalococcoidia bacterium]